MVFEGRRTVLPADVAPGATVSLLGTVDVPRRAGRYRLRWDLVRESVTWFSERGNATGDQLVDVSAADAAAPEAPLPVERRSLEDLLGRRAPGRPELWRAALALWRRHPLLGVGPDNFRHLYPQVLPPGEHRFDDERLHANSLYLETLADLGLCGALALALILIALARVVRAHVTDGDGRLLRLACGVAAGTFFVHGLVDTFLAFTPLYGLHWLLLGLTAQTDSSP
jgi:O-antigen ligase